MYAQLGNVQFTGLLSPDSFRVEKGASLPQLATVEGKPRIQSTGNELDTISLSMHLHYGFCTPDVEYDTLVQAMQNATAMPLLMGNGRYLGDFLIEGMTYTVLESFADGTVLEARVDAELVEYVEPDPANAAKKAAVAAGAGMAGNKPQVLLKPIASQAASDAFLGSVRDAKMQTAEVNQQLAAGQQNANRLQRALQRARKAAKKAQEGMKAAESTLRSAQQLQNQAQGALQQVRQAGRNIERMQQALEPPVDLNDAITASRAASFSIDNVTSASTPILALSGTKRG